MQRRSFIKAILAGVVAPMFLPGADRIWRPASREMIVHPSINPEWVDAPYEVWFGYWPPAAEAIERELRMRPVTFQRAMVKYAKRIG